MVMVMVIMMAMRVCLIAPCRHTSDRDFVRTAAAVSAHHAISISFIRSSVPPTMRRGAAARTDAVRA